MVTAAALATTAVATVAILDHLRGDAARAEVGDCLNDADAPARLRRVDCDHADAAWVVAHRIGGVPEAEFADPIHREELCQAAVEWEVAFWIAREPEAAGDVMCLRPR